MNKKEEAAEQARLRRLYKEKNQYLNTFYEEVEQVDFYRDIFPVGSFERQGHTEDAKPNGLALDIRGKGRAYHHIITDELGELEELNDREFVIMSPIGYFGMRRSAENARYLYAYTFDLDGVEIENLRDVIHQMNNGIIPKATYIVNSGTGLHLYYLFNEPIALYPSAQKQLKEMKYALIERIWNNYTSSFKDKQRQGIMQGFRIVGSPSKLGAKFPVVAYLTGERVDLEDFNDFIPAEAQIIDIKYKSTLPIAEAKQKYPEWYDRRIVRGERRGRWEVKRDLYDWWKRRILSEIVVGHRFYGIFTLAIYAKKCNITEEELRKDAYEIMVHFDNLSNDYKNRFTEDDVEAALSVYNEDYVTFPRDDISKISGLPIQANKRNGRKQKEHLRLMRGIKMLKAEMGENVKGGRPRAEMKIQRYLWENPQQTNVSEIARALGMSRTTVYKYLSEQKRK